MAGSLTAEETRKIRRSRGCDLSDRGLTVIPADLVQFADLLVLWLHRNQLTAFPQELAQLTSLQTLFVQRESADHPPPRDRPAHQPRAAVD